MLKGVERTLLKAKRKGVVLIESLYALFMANSAIAKVVIPILMMEAHVVPQHPFVHQFQGEMQ